MILSAMKPRFQKVAMIIGLVSRAGEDRGLDLTDEQIAERITALSQAGMINAMGNLDNWRFSEVALKPEQGA